VEKEPDKAFLTKSLQKALGCSQMSHFFFFWEIQDYLMQKRTSAHCNWFESHFMERKSNQW